MSSPRLFLRSPRLGSPHLRSPGFSSEGTGRPSMRLSIPDTWAGVISATADETKENLILGLPVMLSFLFYVTIELITMMMLGRQPNSETNLAVAGLCSIVSMMFGISPIYGVITAQETMVSRSFGGGRFVNCGIILQRSMIICSVLCVFLSGLWLLFPWVLEVFGVMNPDPGLVFQYISILVFGLWPQAIVYCLHHYFMSCEAMWPAVHVLFVANIFHVVTAYLLIIHFEYGLVGAAASYVATYWATLFIFLIYLQIFRPLEFTWNGWTYQSLDSAQVKKFLTLALPGIALVCFECWGYHLTTLIAVRFGVASVAAQSILGQTASIFVHFSESIGIAVCCRIGIASGAFDAPAMKLIAESAFVQIMSILTVLCTVVAILRHEWASMFGGGEQVIALVETYIPLIMIYCFFDGAQLIGISIIRGCGLQSFGAYVYLISYWLVGLPIACLLTFVFDFKLVGIWWGLVSATAFQTAIMGHQVFFKTNWKTICYEAQESEDPILEEDEGQAADK